MTCKATYSKSDEENPTDVAVKTLQGNVSCFFFYFLFIVFFCFFFWGEGGGGAGFVLTKQHFNPIALRTAKPL